LAEKVVAKREIDIKNIENGFGGAEIGDLLSKVTGFDFRKVFLDIASYDFHFDCFGERSLCFHNVCFLLKTCGKN